MTAVAKKIYTENLMVYSTGLHINAKLTNRTHKRPK